MRILKFHISLISAAFAVLVMLYGENTIAAKSNSQTPPQGEYLQYIIENGDTVYMDEIRPSKVFPKLPKQKGKDWRRYYRLVYNFNKAYPYALIARELVIEADSVIAADNLTGLKRQTYVDSVQKKLFKAFEKSMRNMTVSQGALLMRLIDRETGKSSYNIIKEFKSKVAAGFWQGIAKICGTDMKKNYDPTGIDANTEELVTLWHDGDFNNFYFSLFWEDPPKVRVPNEFKHLLKY